MSGRALRSLIGSSRTSGRRRGIPGRPGGLTGNGIGARTGSELLNRVEHQLCQGEGISSDTHRGQREQQSREHLRVATGFIPEYTQHLL